MNRVIFVNRFFYPDYSATSQLLSDLAFHLATENWNVTVVTSRQAYEDPEADLPSRESIRGVDVRRVWSTAYGRDQMFGRAVDALTFHAAVFFALRRLVEPGTVVVAATDPPLISVPVSLATGNRDGVFINWIQDLFPEVAEAVGVIAPNGPVARALRAFRNNSLQRAETNVVVGARMEELLRRKKMRTVLRPNWADGREITPLAASENPMRKRLGIEDAFVVEYSGNLGRVHDYRTILGAVRELSSTPGIRFVFVGGGERFRRLEARVQAEHLSNATFLPYQSRAALRTSLGIGDVHLVSLEPVMEGLVVPSKVYGIAAAGRPMIFVGDSRAETATLIARSECGVLAAKGDPLALAQIIRSLAADRPKVEEMGRKARELFEREFDAPMAFEEWNRILVWAAEESRGRSDSPTTANESSGMGRAAILFTLFAVLLLIAMAVTTIPIPGSSPEYKWIPEPPKALSGDRQSLARSLARSPSDRRVLSSIVDRGLDFDVPGRIALWHGAHQLLERVSPTWRPAQIPYIRAGFFHWTELSSEQKGEVLREAGVLLRDPVFFPKYYPIIWQVTGDLKFLEENRPDTTDAVRALATLAARHGRFSEYRELRGKIYSQQVRDFERLLETKASSEMLLEALCSVELREPSNPLIVRYLTELARNPARGERADPARLSALFNYVAGTTLGPLQGLLAIDAKRVDQAALARLANRTGDIAVIVQAEQASDSRKKEWQDFFVERALRLVEEGDILGAYAQLGRVVRKDTMTLPGLLARAKLARMEKDGPQIDFMEHEIRERFEGERVAPEDWQGLCGSSICDAVASTMVYVTVAREMRVTARSPEAEGGVPYLEVYVDDALAAEGPIVRMDEFVLSISTSGIHRIEVRIVNPISSAGVRRKVEIS